MHRLPHSRFGSDLRSELAGLRSSLAFLGPSSPEITGGSAGLRPHPESRGIPGA